MDAFLNFSVKVQAYADRGITGAPKLRFADWIRDAVAVTVSNPKTEPFELAPGEQVTVFDGTRTIAFSGASTFSFALSSLAPNRYRLTWTGGTDPVFRTARVVALNGQTLTFTVQTNGMVVLECGAGTGDFTNVVVGDSVFVPNITTGDAASPISVLNSGSWVVLAKASATKITLGRLPGMSFEAVSESATLTADSQIQFCSYNGVQVGDKMELTLGGTGYTMDVVLATATFVEVVSGTAFPDYASLTPAANELAFHTEAKRLVYVESDQLVSVRINGSTSDFDKIEPFEAGNPDRPGVFLKVGPAWSLVLKNLTTATANVVAFHCE